MLMNCEMTKVGKLEVELSMGANSLSVSEKINGAAFVLKTTQTV